MYRVVHLAAFTFEVLFIVCGSLLMQPLVTGSILAGVIVSVLEFALAELLLTPIRQMFVGQGWAATVAKVLPDEYQDTGYEKPTSDVTGAEKSYCGFGGSCQWRV